MELIGPIVRLQVQPTSLKVEERPRRYDPSPLRAVPALRLEPAGVTGLDEDGDPVGDVHHRDHPASKHREGSNGLSVGFTSHYDAMRARFGSHLGDGLAGENILVATERRFTEDDLAAGLVIETTNGEPVHLVHVVVATPCVEFARFALRFPPDARPDRTVSDAIAFLDAGVRGYYATPRSTAVIRVGDRVFLAA